jgi:hypothetical protein
MPSYWLNDYKGARQVSPEDTSDKSDQITLALVAQTADLLLPDDSLVRGDIEEKAFLPLLEARNSHRNLPWDNVGRTDESGGRTRVSLGGAGPAFTTGRILDDLRQYFQKYRDQSGKNRAKVDAIIDQAKRGLTAWLVTWLAKLENWSKQLYLPIVYRAAVSLKAYNVLKVPLQVAVARYSQHVLYRMISSHGLRSHAQVDPTLWCLALLADVEFTDTPLTDRLPDDEHRRCLDHVFGNDYQTLPDACRTTITRLGPVAIGCSGVEVLLRMLRNPILAGDLEEHEDQLLKTVDWIQTHSLLKKKGEKGGVYDFKCDLYLDRTDLWFCAIVIQFLDELRKFVASQKRKDFRAFRPDKKLVRLKDVACGGFQWKEDLERRLLPKVKKQRHTDEYTGNGIVLFGPPGTGKTTIAKAVALELGWEFVKLSPVDFLEKGQSRLFATIKALFRDLKQLQHSVIFFDEMELLVLERAKELDWTTHLVTNVMLPELQEIHDCKEVIPILATNYIDRIETAGRRPGRFDFVLPVGFLTAKESKPIINRVLEDHSGNKDCSVDDLARIPKHATVSIGRAWAVRCIEKKTFDAAAAQDIWESEFSRLCANEKEVSEFEFQVTKFAYPAIAAKKDT